MHHPTVCAVATAVLAALPGAQAGMYPKSSAVLQVDGKNYNSLIAKSNHTTILEFYAPWCGHCKNLQPHYEKAAVNLKGLANVAAIDCDDDANKPFCGRMDVKGFPTLKIIRPGKKAGSPMVEDYNGPRTAAGIVDAVVEKINNHVKRVTDKDLDDFVEKNKDTPKAILFTDKGVVSALLKSVAIDFLDVISVAQIRNKEAKAVERFGVTKFPALVLLPGGDKEPITYDGPVKKDGLVEFLSQAGTPNPAATTGGKKPEKKKAEKKEKKEKTTPKSSPKAKQAEAEQKPIVADETAEGSGSETVKNPVIVDTALPIPTIHSAEKLTKECLNEKSNTCVLAFVPTLPDGEATAKHDGAAGAALDALSEIADKHAKAKRKLFPFFAVHVPAAGDHPVLKALGDLKNDVELVAINARRGWWKRFQGDEVTHKTVEAWVDAIRMGEGAKNKLPEGLVVAVVDGTTPGAEGEASTSSAASSSETVETKATDPTPEPETATEASETPAKDAHDEL